MNTWDYAAISKATEDRITGLMNQSRQVRANGDTREADLLSEWAYGAYLLWDGLTIGKRNDGDGTRMEALTDLDPPS